MNKAKRDFYHIKPKLATCDKKYEKACAYIDELEAQHHEMLEYLVSLVEITDPKRKFIPTTGKTIYTTTKSLVEKITNEVFEEALKLKNT